MNRSKFPRKSVQEKPSHHKQSRKNKTQEMGVVFEFPAENDCVAVGKYSWIRPKLIGDDDTIFMKLQDFINNKTEIHVLWPSDDKKKDTDGVICVARVRAFGNWADMCKVRKNLEDFNVCYIPKNERHQFLAFKEKEESATASNCFQQSSIKSTPKKSLKHTNTSMLMRKNEMLKKQLSMISMDVEISPRDQDGFDNVGEKTKLNDCDDQISEDEEMNAELKGLENGMPDEKNEQEDNCDEKKSDEVHDDLQDQFNGCYEINSNGELVRFQRDDKTLPLSVESKDKTKTTCNTDLMLPPSHSVQISSTNDTENFADGGTNTKSLILSPFQQTEDYNDAELLCDAKQLYHLLQTQKQKTEEAMKENERLKILLSVNDTLPKIKHNLQHSLYLSTLCKRNSSTPITEDESQSATSMNETFGASLDFTTTEHKFARLDHTSIYNFTRDALPIQFPEPNELANSTLTGEPHGGQPNPARNIPPKKKLNASKIKEIRDYIETNLKDLYRSDQKLLDREMKRAIKKKCNNEHSRLYYAKSEKKSG